MSFVMNDNLQQFIHSYFSFYYLHKHSVLLLRNLSYDILLSLSLYLSLWICPFENSGSNEVIGKPFDLALFHKYMSELAPTATAV